jgi:acyl carrier protein
LGLDKNIFIAKIQDEFEEEYTGEITAHTHFKDLPEWGSMQALIITALIETEYDVSITATDLVTLETVSDLYRLVKSRV